MGDRMAKVVGCRCVAQLGGRVQSRLLDKGRSANVGCVGH